MQTDTHFPENTLSSLQLHSLPLLAAGHPQKDVARQLGVDERTLRRWLSDSEYAAALQTARRTTWLAFTAQVQCSATRSVEALTSLLSESTDARIRIRAAQALLGWAARAARLEEALYRAQARDALPRPAEAPEPAASCVSAAPETGPLENPENPDNTGHPCPAEPRMERFGPRPLAEKAAGGRTGGPLRMAGARALKRRRG